MNLEQGFVFGWRVHAKRSTESVHRTRRSKKGTGCARTKHLWRSRQKKKPKVCDISKFGEDDANSARPRRAMLRVHMNNLILFEVKTHKLFSGARELTKDRLFLGQCNRK